jgi:NAD+ kinase
MRKLKIGILFFNEDERTQNAVEFIRAWAERQNHIEVWWPENRFIDILADEKCLNPEKLKLADLIISIGGDGTFLSAARLVAGIQTPILGVHTGKTGFLTDYPVEDLELALDDILHQNLSLSPRLMLDIKAFRQDKKIFQEVILNELLIRPNKPMGMVNLRVEVNGQFLTDFWADFLIISTPTGSTAYNLSAGGPIVYPSSESIIINAVNAPSLSVRPIVIPADAELRIQENEGHECQIIHDGRIQKILSPNGLIQISRSPYVTHFIRSSRYGFVDALREKLGWCGNFRNTRGTD